MIQVGGHAATLVDFEIPARHGLRQTIGDTLGIGGIFRALRTIPVHAGRSAPTWPSCARTHGCSTTPTRWRCSARPTREGSPHKQHGRALPLGAAHDAHARRAGRRALRGDRRSSAPASTTRPSSCASSTTARTSTRCSTRRSSATPSCGAACASRCTAGWATSRPSRASTRPSTCPWFMRDDEAIERYRLLSRRLHPAQRGEPRGVRAAARRAGRRRAVRDRAQPRVRAR